MEKEKDGVKSNQERNDSKNGLEKSEKLQKIHSHGKFFNRQSNQLNFSSISSKFFLFQNERNFSIIKKSLSKPTSIRSNHGVEEREAKS